MTAPAWATNLSDFWLEGATTVSAFGGGASGINNPETDFFIQGTDCISKNAWTNALKGFMVDALGTTFTVPTDGAVIAWGYYAAVGSLDSKANGGLEVNIGDGSGTYDEFYVGGKDTLAFDSWVPYAIDPNTATPDVSGSGGSERWVGIGAYLPSTSGPTKGAPLAIDCIRYGRCDIEYTYGDAGNGYNTFDDAEAYANDPSRRWGLIEYIRGVFLIQGFHSFGVSGTEVDFRDANKVVFLRAAGDNNLTGDAVSTGFNRLEVINASSNVEWDNIIFQALGSRARGVFVHTAGAWSATSCQFVDMDTFDLLSASVATDCIFRRCNEITAPGSDLTGSQVLEPTVAADGAGLIWDSGTNPDGYLDDMIFSKGSNAHHAIEFTTFISSITLRGSTFSGFNASDGQNDSVLYFDDTGSDRSWTVNAVGTTGTISYKKARSGDTVTIVANPVTLNVHVQDANDGTPIVGARVMAVAASGGPKPYQASVGISRSGSTVTVAHTGHGLSTNDYVLIEGCVEGEYNGVWQITVTGVDAYTYTISTTPSSPATGSPISTFAMIVGTTDTGGDISDSRTYASDQPFTGRARKASSSPYYRTGPFSGTIDSSNGADVTVQMVEET